jgi:hypothetical protein
MYKPFQHQVTTSEFLISIEERFVSTKAGTGKTSSVIWAADYLMDLGLIKKF